MPKIREVVKHSLARFLSVLCVFLVLAGIGWAIYVAFVKPATNPTKTTAQKAAQINNPTYHQQPHFGGCANMRVYEYYRKEKK